MPTHMQEVFAVLAVVVLIAAVTETLLRPSAGKIVVVCAAAVLIGVAMDAMNSSRQSRLITCDSFNTLTGLSWPIDLTKDLAEQGCEIDSHNTRQLLCKHPGLEVRCPLP